MDREQVRSELESLLESQLLGPAEALEVLDARPSDVYLTGVLWPRQAEIDAGEDDGGLTELADVRAESASVEAAVPGYRAIRPCSIGITFEVDVGARVTISLDSTSRYVEQVVETPAGDRPDGAGGPTYQWRRKQLDHRLVIPHDETRLAWRTNDFIGPGGGAVHDGDVALDVRRRLDGSRCVFTVTLINTATGDVPRELREKQMLLQSRILVSATMPDDSPAIRARTTYPFADDDEDQLVNLLLYRDVQEFAVGHGIAAEWPAPEMKDRVRVVATTWLPRARVESMSPDGHASVKPLKARDPCLFAAATLSRMDRRQETCSDLLEFLGLYGRWIETTLVSSQTAFDGQLRDAADRNVERCVGTLQRLKRGVEVLRTSDVAWKAFTLANLAMDRQSRFPSRGDRSGPLVWRPFQLAFVLMVIPGLVDALDPDRDTMDLLWFPTGGGKTEAYLALSAFEIFRRRLGSDERRGSGGVDVIMRYTLRLLTVQQFQRAAALITACELIRREDVAHLGVAPISLGLYVGADSTPNGLEEAASRLSDEARGLKPASTPRQLLNCPVCGGKLPTAAYRIDDARHSMDVTCPGDGCEAQGIRLPILTVDEAIYAFPPSLLIGTVDKFAQLPRNANLGVLFGGSSPERLGLIIQDELHLISGPLGSMTGLYEACVDWLSTHGTVRPKIIGSTATIGRAARQVRALFDRDVLQFPPPGIDAADSFFAVRDEEGPDRIYRGVATAGRSPKFALQALIASLMQSVFEIRESGQASERDIDPYWTCVGYFNSLRELGGAHVLMLDDVRRQIGFLAGRKSVTPRSMDGPPLELSSRVSSREIPEILDRLNRPLGSDDVFASPPPDAVLASNMISVGVDVPRLGVMAVAGQPKSTAEYIQATSRVGRGLPGLVVTLYNFGRPRDLSHFEHFQSYHTALYRSVEATSVTPWAPRARDKALHAVLAAIVRHGLVGMDQDEDAIRFDPDSPDVKAILQYLSHRAGRATDGLEENDTIRGLQNAVSGWSRKCAEARATRSRLLYWEKRTRFNKHTAPHLMRSAEQMRSDGSSGVATPNSMREVEPSSAFVLRPGRRRSHP